MPWFTTLANAIRSVAPTRKRSRGRRPRSKSLTVESLESRQLLTAIVMTPHEQLLVELVNRARLDPAAEAARYGIDLNQGLTPGTISSDPKQPLAPNQILIDVTGAHSADMLANNYFSHTNLDNKSPSQRAAAAGYPVGVAENISLGGSTGPIDQEAHVYERHRRLFISTTGHRQNILNPVRQEFGTGVRFGRYTDQGTTFNASIVTENFANPPGDNFLTGVVFTDAADNSADDDDFFTIGEQIGSGTITATAVGSGQIYTTMIGPSGGYALQIPSGTYTVTAGGGALSTSYVVENVVLASENVKVDFETTTATVVQIENVRRLLVNSTGDWPDADLGDGTCQTVHAGECTLRAALAEANASANLDAGPDVIVFDIAGAGPHSIQPQSVLPTITDPVVIDGTTEPDFGGTPVIEIDGTSAGAGASGLTVAAGGGGSTIRGLAVNRFDAHGIFISRRDNVTVENNYIGTDTTGAAGLGNGRFGVYVLNGDSNTITGNLISGNDESGIKLEGTLSNGNLITANLIGTDAAGRANLRNRIAGIDIAGASSTTVGGLTAAERNVISGGKRGVMIRAGATHTIVQANYIGTDAAGTAEIRNSQGIFVQDADTNTIGGAGAAGNLISGNTTGIFIHRGNDNLVGGNWIGTDASGLGPLGNVRGVLIRDGANNRIGNEPNVISGNAREGVRIFGAVATGNVVQGNLIGTNAAGEAAIPNRNGVRIAGDAGGNTIGGTTPAARNVISGNSDAGLVLQFSGNSVQGNFIGTNAAGDDAVPNATGVLILRSGNQTIGGTGNGAGNLISGNRAEGVRITGIGATGNSIVGNAIGTDSTGLSALGNKHGVVIESAGNTVGGASAAAGNVISGNMQNGVYLLTAAATGNMVRGNRIGINIDGTAAVANARSGVLIEGAPNNMIGGAGAGNAIGGNTQQGVKISGPAATGNVVLGNSIGFDAMTSTVIANRDGVRIADGAIGNTIGGAAGGEANQIAGNTGRGVWISDGSGNMVTRNSIHDNAALGISIGGQARTPNDVDDSDVGANNLQNFPEMATAMLRGGNLDVEYWIAGIAGNSALPVLVEFFLADSDGEEGETFLGQHSYAGPGTANASIPAGAARVGSKIVATATDADGNTSEFSAAVTVAAPPL